MRKKAEFRSRVCKLCGNNYIPTGAGQVYCKNCAKIKQDERRKAWYHKAFPDAKPKVKHTEPCCVCGEKFSAFYDGKPYCNKHWLRMYNNGTIEIKKRKNNCEFIEEGNTLKIITKKGETIIADVDDKELLSKNSWCLRNGYAVANINHKVVPMHRVIMGLESGDKRIVDHINRNPQDNRKCNLRFCTQKENSRNTSLCRKHHSTGHIGIQITPYGKYNARIEADGKHHHIGNFDTLEEAIAARNAAEDYYHGEFASHKAN